jgi:hypothetical protein
VRLLLPLALAGALLLAGAARPVPCAPVSCAPSQFTFAGGTLLGVRAAGLEAPLRVIDLRAGRTRWRLPPGVVAGDTLVHQDGSLVSWFDAARGARTADAVLQAHGAFRLVGVAQDGTRAVLARTQTLSTTFAIVSPRTERIVRLGGHDWSFDALNGRSLFLIQTLAYGYQVRLYDLAANTLQRRPLKDPHERALIQGTPFARASTPDGRFLFTLYVGTNGYAMVHELDTVAGFAHCIDLPATSSGAATTWGLAPDPANHTLWAVSPAAGRVVGIDVRTHAVRLSYSFQRTAWTANAVAAALSPDGGHVAFSDGLHLWVAVPAEGLVVAEPSHAAIALGWAPDQSKLWVVGERSRVSPLPLRLR